MFPWICRYFHIIFKGAFPEQTRKKKKTNKNLKKFNKEMNGGSHQRYITREIAIRQMDTLGINSFVDCLCCLLLTIYQKWLNFIYGFCEITLNNV